MKNKRSCTFLIALILAGCQSAPVVNSTVEKTPAVTNDAWNGLHLDLVQFLAEEKGFTCLAPSGLDFTSDGQAFKKTLCFKTEKCETTNRVIYLDAHSMLVTSAQESHTPQPGQCKESETNSGNEQNAKSFSK